MLAWVFFLLALRSFFLAWREKKKPLHIAAGVLSLIFFFLLPGDFQWQPLAVIAAIIGVSLYRRTPKKFSTSMLFASIYAFGALAIIFSAFFRLSDEKKIGKIVLTGKTEQQWVTWKNPANEHLESSWMTAYEVVIEDSKGKEISRQFVYGDLVGVRAEIITIRWPFHLLGFSNLCHIETLYNGYTTVQRHNFLPHQSYPLSFPLKGLQLIWEKLYRGEWKIPGIKNGSLESTYFPLTTSDLKPFVGSFHLNLD